MNDDAIKQPPEREPDTEVTEEKLPPKKPDGQGGPKGPEKNTPGKPGKAGRIGDKERDQNA